ncbi:MAG: thioredoxin [Acidimicrobiia bacterium]
MITEVTTENFQREVLDAEGPVVADFYAPWCSSCKVLAPEFEALSREWDGDGVRFVQLDVDQAPALASRYQVSSIPTVLLFEDGRVTGRTIGAKPKHLVASELGLHRTVEEDSLGVVCNC